MANVRDRIATELGALIKEGTDLLKLTNEAGHAKFVNKYQQWYSRALSAVRHLLPDREMDFRRLYDRDTKRKTFDAGTYTLEDYLQGLAPADASFYRFYRREGTFDIHQAAQLKFHNQVMILRSAASRLPDILADIRGVVQAGLFDSELDAARHLKQNGHLRAGGAVAGVVLEGHLAELCSRHRVPMRKKEPHISDYNDALKKAEVFDVPQWRAVQRMGDIRNLCDHKKQREPTADEVEELIDSVGKAIKTLM